MEGEDVQLEKVDFGVGAHVGGCKGEGGGRSPVDTCSDGGEGDHLCVGLVMVRGGGWTYSEVAPGHELDLDVGPAVGGVDGPESLDGVADGDDGGAVGGGGGDDGAGEGEGEEGEGEGGGESHGCVKRDCA